MLSPTQYSPLSPFEVGRSSRVGSLRSPPLSLSYDAIHTTNTTAAAAAANLLDNRDNDPREERLICRYGCGCTHIHEMTHLEKYWHPSVPILDKQILSSNFICVECGLYFKSITQLQRHLMEKTAWSNESLVNCRISYLVDMREWQEALVIKFYKGKHLLDNRFSGTKRWIDMKHVSFYIFERPTQVLDPPFQSFEVKDSHPDEIAMDRDQLSDDMSAIDRDWIYYEDISKEYSFAQSVLFQIYGDSIQETGHRTRGHLCVTDSDKDMARMGQGSLLYGELLPRGANKAFSANRLNVKDASVLFDMGMGTGKILIQAFLQFPHLTYLFGVELSEGRYTLAEDAVLDMVELLGPQKFKVFSLVDNLIVIELDAEGQADCSLVMGIAEDICLYLNSGANISEMPDHDACLQKKVDFAAPQEGNMEVAVGEEQEQEEFTIANVKKLGPISRIFHISRGNMFDVCHIHTADIVMLETDIPSEMNVQLCQMFASMKPFARTLTYTNFRKVWENSLCYEDDVTDEILFPPFPFKQLACNRYASDRYPTSWSVQRGHHFMIWIKTYDIMANVGDDDERKDMNANGNIAEGSYSGVNIDGREYDNSQNTNDNDNNSNNNSSSSSSKTDSNSCQVSPVEGKKSISNQQPITHHRQSGLELRGKRYNRGSSKKNKHAHNNNNNNDNNQITSISTDSCCLPFSHFIRYIFGLDPLPIRNDTKIFVDGISEPQVPPLDDEEDPENYFYGYSTDVHYLAYMQRARLRENSSNIKVSGACEAGVSEANGGGQLRNRGIAISYFNEFYRPKETLDPNPNPSPSPNSGVSKERLLSSKNISDSSSPSSPSSSSEFRSNATSLNVNYNDKINNSINCNTSGTSFTSMLSKADSSVIETEAEVPKMAGPLPFPSSSPCARIRLESCDAYKLGEDEDEGRKEGESSGIVKYAKALVNASSLPYIVTDSSNINEPSPAPTRPATSTSSSNPNPSSSSTTTVDYSKGRPINTGNPTSPRHSHTSSPLPKISVSVSSPTAASNKEPLVIVDIDDTDMGGNDDFDVGCVGRWG